VRNHYSAAGCGRGYIQGQPGHTPKPIPGTEKHKIEKIKKIVKI
jgi:hypothetical protein